MNDAAVTAVNTANANIAAKVQHVINGKVNPHLYNMKKVSYTFRKDDLGVKRPAVEVEIPDPTLDCIIEGLSDDKIRKFIVETLQDAIKKQGKVQVTDELHPVTTQADLDISKLTLDYIANIPPSERLAGGIEKEVWEAFSKDYIAVMPSATGYNLEQVTNAATLFVKIFRPVKAQKKILGFLKGQLSLYFTQSSNQEEFGDIYSYLDGKIDELMKADEDTLLANLGASVG